MSQNVEDFLCRPFFVACAVVAEMREGRLREVLLGLFVPEMIHARLDRRLGYLSDEYSCQNISDTKLFLLSEMNRYWLMDLTRTVTDFGPRSIPLTG